MPVPSAFFAWREAEHAALNAQTAIHRAHVDHWIGQAPAPDPHAVAEAAKLQMRARQLLRELLSDMQATARALGKTAADRRRRSGECDEERDLTVVPGSEPLPALSWREWMSTRARTLPDMRPAIEVHLRESSPPRSHPKASARVRNPM